MNDLRHRIHHNGGLLAAIGLFIVMFIIYISNHPVGLTAAVATTASNKAVLLALVAMAQTLPVLTRGLDLSVGMVFILANCLASVLVIGTIGEGLLGITVVLGAGALAGLHQRGNYCLGPAPANYHDAGDWRNVLRDRALHPSRSRRRCTI